LKKGDKQKIVKVRFQEEIIQLRYDGWSWRDIEQYLARYHKFKISYRHLKDIIQPVAEDDKPSDIPVYDTVEVERLTNPPAETCDMLAGYFAGLSDEEQVNVHRIQTDMIRRHRGKSIDKGPEFFYAMFMLALHKMCNAKTQTLENKPAGMYPAIRPKKKPETKKEKIKKYYDQVKKLRDDGWSWEKIARALDEDKRVKIGPIWLQRCFEQITADREAKKGREAALKTGDIHWFVSCQVFRGSIKHKQQR